MKKEIRMISKEDSDVEDIRYWQAKSHEERLDAIQYLRMQWVIKFHNRELYDESRKGLRRVYRIIEQE
jgi:hypothetical protein